MSYYDFHVHSAFSEGESTPEEMANRAKILGYKGMCFVVYYKGKENLEKIRKEIEDVSKRTKLEIFLGIEARNIHELNKLAKIRREFDILLARGHDINFNRKSVEMPEVDILTHPEFERKDSGLNHIMIKLFVVVLMVYFLQIL